jgi:hypothetical protein
VATQGTSDQGAADQGPTLTKAENAGPDHANDRGVEASEVVSYVVMRLEDELYEQLLQGLRLT